MRILIALIVVQAGTLGYAAPAATLGEQIAGVFREPSRLAEVTQRYQLAQSNFIERIYRAAGYRPLWAASDRRDALLAAIATAQQDGLRAADYHQAQLRALSNSDAPSLETQAEFDILMTEAFARLAYHLRFGKASPRALDANWNFSRTLVTDDPAQWFYQAISVDGIEKSLAWLRPQTPSYERLKTELATLRAVAAADGLPVLPDGPTLKPGMSDPRVRILRDRMTAFSGESSRGNVDPDMFDPVLEATVREFQRRHGLFVDGLVGKDTRTAMNVPVEARIDQIRVNLERIRWVFRDFVEEFVAVNIAAFHAAYIRNGAVVWQARAVVGRPYRQTPIFRTDMTHIIFNPTWTVPPTILKKDVLPGVRKDPDYLTRKGLRVLDAEGGEVDPSTIDWPRISAAGFPYLLRQAPGPKNALGRVKFIFPNRHLVFMHDTPSVELFGRAERTFSSGCIRIDRPLELAAVLLEKQSNGPVEIENLLAGSAPRRVDLVKPVPVMLLYLTAFADFDGTMHFRRDVYQRDAAVLAALNGPFRFDPPAGYPAADANSRGD